jgi:uncharacterized membrane protein
VPLLAPYHPHLVHFVIALLVVGVVLRLVSLVTARFGFTGPAATTLILLGTLVSVPAVQSGVDAHGPVERIPGARDAVVEHEEWGERARNAFLIVSLLELVALATTLQRSRYARPATMVAAAAGVVGLVVLYEAAEHGGELVYGYAGGVGIRSGDPADVNRLFIAGAYQQALQDREQGRGEQGAALLDIAAARFPDHTELHLLAIEWTTDVRKDPASALQKLDGLRVPSDNARLRARAGLARANALAAQGHVDGARAVLQTLRTEFPNNAQIQRRLGQLGKAGEGSQ